MACVSETIAACFVDRQLDAAQTADVEQHIDRCEACRKLIVALRRTTPLADGSGGRTLPAVSVAVVEPGTQLGRYVVVERLGAGAMASVYAAHDPQIDRTVAIKLLRHDAALDSELAVRLSREAQALARVDHPNVVRIYDVGELGDQVFIAMELVRGQTLRAWLVERERSIKEIVEVFVAAARGLAAAHGAGIVHRDFKPENVLVRIDGQVKVSDFGLAATESAAPSTTAEDREAPRDETVDLTRTGTVLGTPAYMSPEQIAGGAVDARSDQFGFCVSLYEAAYGTRPFTGRSLAELSDQIRSGVRSLPTATRVPSWLRRVMARGLAVDPADRFPTMDALITVLDRRSTRSRWTAIGGLAAIALTLGGSYARNRLTSDDPALVCEGAAAELAGTWDAQRRSAVEAAFVRAGVPYAADSFARTAQALDDYAGRWAVAHKQACQATRVHATQSEQVLDLRMGCLAERRRDLRAAVTALSTATAAEVRDGVALVGELDAIADCDDVRALSTAVRPPADPKLRERVDAVGTRLSELEASRRSLTPSERASRSLALVAEAREVGYDPVLARALMLAGSLLGDTDQRATAVELLREAIWVADRGRDDRIRALAAVELLRRVSKDANPAEHGPLALKQAEAAVSRLDDDRVRAALHEGHASFLIATGKAREAIPVLRAGLELARRSAPDSLAVADTSLNLAQALSAFADPAEAIAEHERAAALYEQVLGPKHPRVLEVRSELAVELLDQAKYDQVVTLLVPTIAGLQDAYGARHSQVANARRRLGVAYRKLGKLDDGKRELEAALEIHRSVLGDKHPEVATTLDHLARLALDRKDHATAITHLTTAIEISRQALGPQHPQLGILYGTLGNAYRMQGKLPEAVEAYKTKLAITEASSGPNSPGVTEALATLGGTLVLVGDARTGIGHLERALALRQKLSSDPLESIAIEMALATALWDSKTDRPRAVKLAEHARSLFAERGQDAKVKAVDAQLATWKTKRP